MKNNFPCDHKYKFPTPRAQNGLIEFPKQQKIGRQQEQSRWKCENWFFLIQNLLKMAIGGPVRYHFADLSVKGREEGGDDSIKLSGTSAL